jgi:hypothetical protein
MSRNQITCDAAFDALTRGPFPTGRPEDHDVERHLRACHECRTLAEALRPAVALLHESVTDLEARDLPSYHGPLGRPNRLAWLTGDAGESRWGFTRSGVIAVTTLMAAVVALAAVVHWSAPPRFHATASAAVRPAARLSGEGSELLVALGLREPCTPASYVTMLAGGMVHELSARDGLACCTECHSAPRYKDLSGPAIRNMIASCRACHETS